MTIKLIEFAFENQSTPKTMLIDVADISRIEENDKTSHKETCIIVTKKGERYTIYGKYTTLSNRWIYTLSKNVKVLEDEVIRPSLALKYNNSLIGVDNINFDYCQLKNLILAIKPSLLESHPELLE